ncbi:MAG: hypothetical protein KKF56_04900 [Nanoarchaeota archaeon]|nr:hypothetical protein [Nanoarchaeota archaeon]
MREFIYYSKRAVTEGKYIGKNLMHAGRMDIVCNFVIQSLFISNDMRKDVKIHLVFDGQPDPTKHLELFPGEDLKGEIEISKKDIAGLIKRMLYKYKEGRKNKIVDGYYVEKKSLIKVIDEMIEEGKQIYILDKKGEDIRNVELNDDAVFLIGDHDGLPKKEMKSLKKKINSISVGPNNLFASQVVVLINNEVDRR